jgi:ribosome-binding protein aMBF1 (putative translation factor)
MVSEPFHQLMEAARKRAGLSHDQFSELAWTTPSYTFRICSGKAKPSRDMVMRLCIALNFAVDETDEMLRAAGHVGLLDLEKKPSATIPPAPLSLTGTI